MNTQAAQTNKKVVLIDDNVLNLKMLAFSLRAHGYAVTPAVSAQQALEMLAVDLPDVILMDLQMPGTSGFELAAILKNRNDTSVVPIIAVTAYAMKGDEQRALASGCDGYVSKPIEIGSLLSKIERLTGQSAR